MGKIVTSLSTGRSHRLLAILELMAKVSEPGRNIASSGASRNEVWLATIMTRSPAS